MVVGCVIFYNDGIKLLEACLKSLSKVTDKIIAIDGAFKEFPHSFANSNDGCRELAEQFATTIVSAPSKDGWDDQVQKRNAYLLEARKLCKEGDYLLLLDADETIEGKKPSRLKEDFYKIKIITKSENKLDDLYYCRLLRFHPDIRYIGKHISLSTKEGYLINLTETDKISLFPGLEILHTPGDRSKERLAQDGEYLRKRKESSVLPPVKGPEKLTEKEKALNIPIKVLQAYRGYSQDGVALDLHPGEVVLLPIETAARLLVDFPTWFKEGE